jgi:hypothetical protein
LLYATTPAAHWPDQAMAVSRATIRLNLGRIKVIKVITGSKICKYGEPWPSLYLAINWKAINATQCNSGIAAVVPPSES